MSRIFCKSVPAQPRVHSFRFGLADFIVSKVDCAEVKGCFGSGSYYPTGVVGCVYCIVRPALLVALCVIDGFASCERSLGTVF